MIVQELLLNYLEQSDGVIQSPIGKLAKTLNTQLIDLKQALTDLEDTGQIDVEKKGIQYTIKKLGEIQIPSEEEVEEEVEIEEKIVQTKSRTDQILELYLNGLSGYKIAKQMKIYSSQVYDTIARYKRKQEITRVREIEIRKKEIKDDNKKKV